LRMIQLRTELVVPAFESLNAGILCLLQVSSCPLDFRSALLEAYRLAKQFEIRPLNVVQKTSGGCRYFSAGVLRCLCGDPQGSGKQHLAENDRDDRFRIPGYSASSEPPKGAEPFPFCKVTDHSVYASLRTSRPISRGLSVSARECSVAFGIAIHRVGLPS